MMKTLTLGLLLIPYLSRAESEIDKCLALLDKKQIVKCESLALNSISNKTSKEELDQWSWLAETKFSEDAKNKVLESIKKSTVSNITFAKIKTESTNNTLDQFHESMQKSSIEINDRSQYDAWKWLIIGTTALLVYQQLKDKNLEITKW